MSTRSIPSNDSETPEPNAPPLEQVLAFIIVVLAGVLITANLAPMWIPGMRYSVTGDAPKFFWFISRGSAIAAYWILWLSMAFGIIITNKMAQVWPGIPPAYEIHQYTSILGLGFGLFHALVLMADQYIHYNLGQVLIPFTSANYRPIWVGIGQISFYIWAVVTFSFYIRKRIGKKAWRLIHFASYACFLGIMIHGIFSGTDAATTWVHVLYWFSGGSLLFLTVYRVLAEVLPQSKIHEGMGSRGKSLF